jgi:Cupin domain
MTDAPYTSVHISEVPEAEYGGGPGDPDWKPLRRYLGITAFGTNVFVARAPGERAVVDHTEVDDSGTRHEELYFVVRGHATFTIGGREVEAPAGTVVYVPDPETRRVAVAREEETTVLCFGGTPGEAFSVSPWERRCEGYG